MLSARKVKRLLESLPCASRPKALPTLDWRSKTCYDRLSFSIGALFPSIKSCAPRCGVTHAMTNMAIVGGGLAGLAAADALARIGIRAEVFEAALALGEIGAAVNVAPERVTGAGCHRAR